MNEKFDEIINVISHICSDMMEPVSYLPWGILAGVMFFAVEKVRCRYFGRYTGGRQVMQKQRWVLFLCIVYSIVLLNLTFFSREPGSRIGVTIEIFGTWGDTATSHAYFIENILLFIPFGILFPHAFPLLRKFRFCILEGFLFSVFLESVQFITGRGYCQLDDVLTNTLGAGIGWGFYKIWMRNRKKRLLKTDHKKDRTIIFL